MISGNIFNKNLALFVGAGASIAYPCNLPSFYRMRDFITETLYQNIPHIKMKHIDNIQTKPEMLLQIIWEYFDKKINPLKGFEHAPSNINHFIISNICKKGVRFIITTNFDRCIEKALEEQHIGYKIFYKSPSCEAEVNVLKQMISDEHQVFIWKPHGDCLHTETLCYTIEQVARLNVSKHLRSVYEFILQRYNLLTLGYSGYDDDLFPMLLDFPKNNEVCNNVYWNAYSEVKPNTPPSYLQKAWKNNFYILTGDMQTILSDFKNETIQIKINTTKSGQDIWEKEVKTEISKLTPDWTITVLGQYYHRLQLYDDSLYLWQKGLEYMDICEINRLRFELNSIDIDNLYKFQEIYMKSMQLGEYKISQVALFRIIKCLIMKKKYKEAKTYLKSYKKLINQYPIYFKYSDYAKSIKDYLDSKYQGNDRRINDFYQRISLYSYENSKLRGDIIAAIEALKSYIASLALDNRADKVTFQQILNYTPILEAYNIPTNIADLYFAIAMYASRIHDNKLGLEYIDKCLSKLESCYENRIYDDNGYFELKALTLHQKSMFGTAKAAIPLCKEAIKYAELVNIYLKDGDRERYLGVYHSSLGANYLAIKEYKEARKNLKIALSYQLQVHDIRGEFRTLMDFAELLWVEGRKKESIEMFKDAYKKCLSVGESTAKIEETLKRLNLETP